MSVMIHKEGHDAFLMQGADNTHGGLPVAYHLRACSFAAGGNEFLYGDVGITANYHHARAGFFIDLTKQGGQKFPRTEMGRGRHDGALAILQFFKKLGRVEAQVGGVQAEGAREHDFEEGAAIVAEAFKGKAFGLGPAFAKVTHDAFDSYFPAGRHKSPHELAHSVTHGCNTGKARATHHCAKGFEDIEDYFKREVLPFAPDAWIDEKKSKVGYEIPFTRYFYKYEVNTMGKTVTTYLIDGEPKGTQYAE